MRNAKRTNGYVRGFAFFLMSVVLMLWAVAMVVVWPAEKVRDGLLRVSDWLKAKAD